MYQFLKPLLFKIEPEQAHTLTIRALQLAQTMPPTYRAIEALFHYENPSLAVECAGMSFINPFGMAAGFDKHAELIPGLAALGFGHIEIGTVTPKPQPGNDRPRMFRLPQDGALINRMGFNSPGMDVVAAHLETTKVPSTVRVGVNIGKNRTTALENATADYLMAFARLARFGDYVTVNISSPNTPGLRQLHERNALHELLAALMEHNRQLDIPRPLFVKVSPDETPTQLDDVVAVATDVGVAGIIAGNTTLDRTNLRGAAREQTGGLSGVPLTIRARDTIRYLYRATNGRLPIIGVGGVYSGATAYAHIRAGASLVQLYTALVYAGPGLIKTIKQELVALLQRDGLSSITQAIGIDA